MTIDSDLVVRVVAGELDEWAWLCARLEGWLSTCDSDTRCNFESYNQSDRGGPQLEDVTWMLAAMANRMRNLAAGLVTDPRAT